MATLNPPSENPDNPPFNVPPPKPLTAEELLMEAQTVMASLTDFSEKAKAAAASEARAPRRRRPADPTPS